MTQAIAPAELDSPDKMTEKLFDEFDQDNDGKISWEEFCEGAKKDAVIINLLQCDPGTWFLDLTTENLNLRVYYWTQNTDNVTVGRFLFILSETLKPWIE